ncbi:MAG: TspO/MBR family protein [Pirellula sp.]
MSFTARTLITHPNSSEIATTWKPTLLRQLVWLIGFISVCFAAAGLGAAATSSSVGSWYPTLAKPSWNPPNWVFGPVWSALFLMMAVSAWMVWRCQGWRAAQGAMIWFGIQLSLNVFWSFLFFGLQSPGLAFAEILLLWLAVVATYFAFRRKSVTAARMLLPYLVWSSFAVFLNFTIWRLN